MSLGVFNLCSKLRCAQLNEGLETLGGTWKGGDPTLLGIAFSDSGIEHVNIPSTLKVIATQTFFGCKSLKSVEFSEGLEEIGLSAFAYSGIEDVILPSSTRTICAYAFLACEHLRSIRLNEGLEVLGAEVVADGSTYKGTVFF